MSILDMRDGREKDVPVCIRGEIHLKKLAVIVSRGAFNNLVQACELARVAVESGTQVTVLFRDEAVVNMTKEKAGEILLSEAYKGRESKVRGMLREQRLHDVPSILQAIKEKGDVKFSLCRDSMAYFEIPVEQVIAEIEEVQDMDAFWKEEMETASQVVTF